MDMERKNIIRKIEGEIAESLRNASVDSLLIGVSGGADSVALLCACARIASHSRLRVEAVNCNFHLRGDESDRDSAFVVRLCDSLGIPLHTLDYDVEKHLADNPGMSAEMACRELRYADFFRIAREKSFMRVAVAHNSDDDIETMMLNLLRGSGSRGLKGMAADTGKVIRPLLSVRREEIERYLAAIGQDFVTDSSNLSSDYRRNFIRRDILPLMESRWHGARKALSRSVRILKEESEIIECHYSSMLSRLALGDRSLDVYDGGVTAGLILRFIDPFGGNASMAEEIMTAVSRPYEERRWHLGDRYSAVLERDRLTISDGEAVGPEPRIEWSAMPMSEEAMSEVRSCRTHDAAYLPAGEDAYLLREPATGDRIAPLGMKGTRLVSDIIREAGLDHTARAMVRLLVRRSDGMIIWIPGLKRSRHDLLTTADHCIYKAVLS